MCIYVHDVPHARTQTSSTIHTRTHHAPKQFRHTRHTEGMHSPL